MAEPRQHGAEARAGGQDLDAKKDPAQETLQGAALSSALGVASLGAAGGAVGATAGAALGALAGVPLALFTFGVSLPLGFLTGGVVGLMVGSAAGGTVGGLVGVVGYCAACHKEEITAAFEGFRSRTKQQARQLAAAFSSVARPLKGNRASGDRALWFSGASADGGLVLSQIVRDADGRPLTLGQKVGPSGDAVIIFMRHLGCPYCWSQVREWCRPDVAERLRSLGMSGPLLVSIGTPTQLQRFLHANPFVPRELAFVDVSQDFAVYRALGFGNMSLGALPDAGTLRPRFPGLGVRGYGSCIINMAALSPAPRPGTIFAEGTMVLGGNVALRAGKVAYAWGDRMPGDYPHPSEVLDCVAAAAVGPSAAKAA